MKNKPNKSKGVPKKFLSKKFIVGDRLAEICTLKITGLSNDGDLLAVPDDANNGRKKPPHIIVLETGRGKSAVVGDKILAKLRKIAPHFYQASVIKIMEVEVAQPITGIFVATANGGIIEPISRKNKQAYMVSNADTGGALNGELVNGLTLPFMPSMSMGYAKITDRLGRADSPKAASLIASAIHNLPSVFSSAALFEAELSPLPVLSEGRTDLRHIPFVTIDGEDARDFDDAVFAEPDGGGFHLIVAIAEVAFYVIEGSALDSAAFERGNSVYFPDRVIPMLPERLSNGLCSLVPNEDRFCLAVHIWIDASGEIKNYEFVRAIMRSHARLTYEQVEEASGKLQVISDKKDKIEKKSLTTHHLPLITNLNHAYTALASERDNRGALDLDLPEYKIHFDDVGNVVKIAQKERLESHRLIESFMIAANVCAADFLLKHKAAGIYRVHEAPSDEKLEDLRTLLLMSDYRLQKGAISAKHFNRVLKASKHDPNRAMIHTAVLRSQMQAFYSQENLGHFGLALQKYCHFTSPIRRYADLMVHRAIIGVLEQKEKQPTSHLAEIALHISTTERKAMLAERDAADRYKVSFMSHEIGNVFAGVINSLNEYGLFVTLNDTGITGFIPVRNLGKDFFVYDRKQASFIGRGSRTIFSLGAAITIRVQEANAVTASLIFTPENAKFQDLPPLREKYKHKGNHYKKSKSIKH